MRLSAPTLSPQLIVRCPDWTRTWNYSYDSNNRLIRAIAPNPIPGQPGGTSENYGGVPYDYDWVGNRIHPPGDSNPMVYNSADQLTRWPGMHGTAEYPGYVYDNAGNLTTARDATVIDESLTTVASYIYTPAGLLDEADFAYTNATDSKAIKNSWDADSNRVRLGVGTRNSQQGYVESYHHDFVYDPTAGIPAVLEESTSSTTTYYIREPGGSLIARLHPTEGTRYYHFDELGSTRLLTDSSGNVTDKYAYDAYGALLAHESYTGSVSQPYQYVGRLGYHTHWQEPDFGMLQLGVRFYAPGLVRFTQTDPQGDDLCYYSYADDVPTGLVDPWGENPAEICFKVGALCAFADGPLPVGDIIGAVAIGIGVGCVAYEGICYLAQHGRGNKADTRVSEMIEDMKRRFPKLDRCALLEMLKKETTAKKKCASKEDQKVLNALLAAIKVTEKAWNCRAHRD